MTIDRTGPVGLTITSCDTEASAVVGPRLHVAVLDWIPETGIAGAGWFAHLPDSIAAVTVEPESGPRLDLLRDAGLPVTPGLFDVFNVPPEAGASGVFVFFLPGMSGQWRGGLRLEIRYNGGAVQDRFLPATGDFSEIGRIIELAPVDQALSLAERLLARWDDAAAEALPSVSEDWMARLHQRIGRQSRSIAGVDEVVRVGTDGMLLRGRLPVAAVEAAAAITLVNLGGRRVVLETKLPAVPVARSAPPRGIGPDEGFGFAVFASIPELRADERLWFLEAAASDGRIERIPFVCPNLGALVAEAKRADVTIEVAPRMGDFVARDDPLFLLRGGGAMEIDERKLRGQIAFGPERTIERDSTFALRVIVDIAIKALSPAINDPTTAVLAIDQLQRLLLAYRTTVAAAS